MRKIYIVFLALFFMSGMQSIKAQVLAADSLALVDIYNTGDGPNWTNATNWLTGNVHTWAGIVVTGNRVTELSTEGLNMGGIVSPSVGQLTELTSLKIIGLENPVTISPVSGTIPVEIYNLTKLKKLQIKFTMITGGIPAGIEGLTALEEINFQQTYLGGSIPSEVFELPNLKKAYLHQSNFTGAVPLSVTGATQLSRLYMQGNKLEGPLPFVNLPATNVAKVELTGNFFSFADVKPYHDSAANYSLKDDFQYAKEPVDTIVEKGVAFTINGTVLGGEAYAWFKDDGTEAIGGDPELTITPAVFADEGKYVCKAQSSLVSPFDIRTVYNVLMNMTDTERDSLALVDIYNAGDGPNWTNATNWLTGNVSTWAGVVVTGNRVTELSTEGLNMGGVVSPSVGQLTELTSLKIIGLENPVTISPVSGAIPVEIYNLTKLKKLQIKFTMITGGIPVGIEGLTALEEINFQQTYLGGSIPAEVFELPNLKKAYLHQSNFTGAVPSSVTGATQLNRLYLQGNKLEGPLPFVNLPAANVAKVELTGNFFSFADVKPYHDSASNYSLKDDFQYAQETMNFSLTEGDSVAMVLPVVENGEVYTWFYNGTAVTVDVDTALIKPSVSRTDTGEYVCKVQSSLVSAFDIRAIFNINEVIAIPAYVSGSTSADGLKVSLVFDFDIADPAAETANFTVKQGDAVKVVSSIVNDASDTKTIVLNLASAISSSTASITVSYAPGTLQGSTGGSVAAFGPVGVVNNFVTGIKETTADAAGIYPNPFTDKIQVESISPIEEVTIYNIAGKQVIKLSKLSQQLLIIPTVELESGVYFISIKTIDSTSVHKVFRQ